MLAILGYSINLLTLLALVLAIGLVVDDTIVMLENIHRRIEDGEPPLLASTRGADQVLFAVIATTVVLIAVFMPICLWSGKTGKLFTEFSVTITAAVCFSSVVALTLTPMMCSKMLKTRNEDSFLSSCVDWGLGKMENAYDWLLRKCAKMKILCTCAFGAICILMVLGWQQIPGEYEPQEDRSVIMLNMQAPEGTNFYRMSNYADQVTECIMPYIENGEAKDLMMVVPSFGDSDGAVNRGTGILELSPWSQRKESASELLAQIRQDLSALPGIPVQPYLPNGIGARGSAVQFVIGGSSYEELVEWRDKILAKC